MTVATQWTSIFTQKSSVITTQEFVNRICQESESYLRAINILNSNSKTEQWRWSLRLECKRLTFSEPN